MRAKSRRDIPRFLFYFQMHAADRACGSVSYPIFGSAVAQIDSAPYPKTGFL